MQRQALENGGWFDVDAARWVDEDTYWDGNNHISVATGSQWDHEELYVTRQGRFVLHHSSQWQGSQDEWEEIDARDAAEWLVRNHRDRDDLPPAAAALVAHAYEDTEV